MTRVALELDVKVEMRDGTLLNTEVWRPEVAEQVPAILIRSPYPDPVARAALDPVRAVRMGFAVVVQQIRGTGTSDGQFEPWVAEAEDGADTVAWCAAQSWCNRSVATTGLSYLAHAQLYTAGEHPPALRAMVLEVVPNDAYELTYVGGALALGSSIGWSIAQSANALIRRMSRGETVMDDLRMLTDTLLAETAVVQQPLRQVELLRRNFGSWEEWLDHPMLDDWWRERSIAPGPTLPVLCVGGWFDIFLRGTLATWQAVSVHPQSRLVIGPWAHNGRSSALGGLQFGFEAASARVDLMGQELEFLAEHLCPGDPERGSSPEEPDLSQITAAIPVTPAVRAFLMGRNRWCDFDAWPPQAAQTDFYLHSGGGLSRNQPPSASAPEVFTFDPRDPVPTVGGPNLLSDSEAAYQAGPWDQSGLDGRKDIRRFVSEPLAQPLQVVGHVSVTLWAATSATDTDWTAKLVDVQPDGRAFNIADGIIRARHRISVERADFPEPDQPYEYLIDLVATAYEFQAGHRLRLDISSSNFPRFDVNPGNGQLMADAAAEPYITAKQTIYVVADRPSRLTLPVIG